MDDLSEREHLFTVNLNGDRAETLRDEFLAVKEAANNLHAAIMRLTVHGRNYPGAPGFFEHDAESRRIAAKMADTIQQWAYDGALHAAHQEG